MAAVGSDDSALGAKLAARLATALRPPRSEEEAKRIADLARASVSMARRLGDSETLLYVLEFARIGLTYIGPNDEVFELTREAVTLAQLLERRLTLLKLGAPYAAGLLERGHRGEADAVLAAMVALQPGHRLPAEPLALAHLARWILSLRRSHRGGARAGGRGARAWRTGRVAAGRCRVGDRVRRDRDRPPGDPIRSALAPHVLLEIFERSQVPGHQAWVLGAIGRRDEAVRHLREAAGVQQGFFGLMVAAEACILLDDAEVAPRIAGDSKNARSDVPSCGATRPVTRSGPRPACWASSRDSSGNGTKRCGSARTPARSARGSEPRRSRSCRGRRSRGWVSTWRGRDPMTARKRAPHRRAPGRRDVSLRREGDVWAVDGSAAPPFRLKNSKGLAYLAELLAHPDREVHVLTLIGLDHGAGDAGPVLDARAKADYKQRLDALEEEISEAESFGDLGRANRAHEEIENPRDPARGRGRARGTGPAGVVRRGTGAHQRSEAAQGRHREHRPARSRPRPVPIRRCKDGHLLLVHAALDAH